MTTSENLRPDAPAALPRIPGYRIEGVLGRGSTGVVYSAVQVAVDRPVAIKILHPELAGNRRAVRRLQREARTAARLGHPGIISAIDMGEVGGRWWYAMELVEGIDLAERLQERGAMSEREAIRVFTPLVDALQHASEMGVVHRDIKPANVLMDETGRARLVDLGLAFAEDDPRMTRSGGTLGTPHYISPEQARDPGQADTRSDIWSLGATLYHAVVGRPPFVGSSVAEILSSVLYQPIEDPRTKAPHLSKGMSLVLRKCLSRDPDRRYQQPSDLGADLERLRERRAPEVRKATLEPVAHGRPEWLRPAVWAAVIVGAAAVGYGLSQSREGPPQATSAVVRSATLEAILPQVEAGQLNLARAIDRIDRLTAPDAPVVLDPSLRPEADRIRLDLLARLDKALDGLTLDVARSFEQDLAAGDLRAASTRLERDLASGLERATGFAALRLLPGGESAETMQAFVLARRGELDSARRTAVREATGQLRAHLRDVVVPEVERLVAAARYRDALACLDATASDWALAVGLDLDRFERVDQEAILEDPRLSGQVELEAEGVRTAWSIVDGGLVAFVGQEEQRLEELLRSGASDAAGALERAWSQRVQALGLDEEQLPPRARWASREDFGDARGRLQALERARVDEAARQLLQEDTARADAACARRDYGAALAMWEQLLQSSWRDAVRDDMRVRAREAALLVDLVEQAGQRLTGLVGQTAEFEVGGIVRRGRVRGLTDPASYPFTVREEGSGVNLRLALRPTEHTGDAQLVVARDVERLAGAEDALSLDSSGRLTIALFRFHEGDIAGAEAVMPASQVEAELSSVQFDLQRRIAAIRASAEATTQQRMAARDELIGLISGLSRDGNLWRESLTEKIETLLVEYGDLLNEDELEAFRARLAELRGERPRARPEDAYPGAAVERERRGALEAVAWDFDGGAQGWEDGGWRLEPGALTQARAPESQLQFLDLANAARVPLSPALDPRSAMTLELTFDQIEGASAARELIVTLGGVAFVFTRDADDEPRLLAGASSFGDLLEVARAGGDLRTEDYGGFLRTEPNVLRITLGGKRPNQSWSRRVEVSLNGKEIDVTRLYGADEAEPVELDWLAVRSYQPLRILSARLEASEARR